MQFYFWMHAGFREINSISTVALYFLLSARTFLCQLTGKIAVTPIEAIIERKNHVV